MADINSLLANPTQMDYGAQASSAITNASALTKLRQGQDDQATEAAAGQAVANRDLQGAEDIYNQAGKIDKAQVIKQLRINTTAGQLAAKGDVAGAARLHMENGYMDAAQKLTTAQLQQTNATQAKLAGVAEHTDLTPEVWDKTVSLLASQATTAAQRVEIEGFRDFKTGPKIALGVAGKVQEYNNSLIAQRAADMKFAGEGGVRRVEGATPGTVSLNPKTMQANPATFSPDDPSLKTGASAAPEELATAENKTKSTGSEREITAIKEDWEKANPGKTMARSIAMEAYGLKQKQGMHVAGYKTDENGNATEAIPGTVEGTTANTRKLQQDVDHQYDLARAKEGGKKQANIGDVRATIASAALGHLDEGLLALAEPGADSVVGAVHGNPEFQKWRGSMYPKDVATPVTFGKIRGALESAQSEIERLYTQGQGAVTEGERNNLKALVVDAQHAPTAEAATKILLNVKKLVGEIIKAPEVGQIQRSDVIRNARTESTRKVENSIQPAGAAPAPGTPEAAAAANAPGAGVSSGPVTVSNPADVAKLPSGTIFVTPDGRRKVAP
jgi:hypothetical protein